MSEKLNPAKALIFRITHRTNVPWIFEHGIFCRSSSNQDPNYRTIGNPELIYKRASRDAGWGGITKVPNEDVVIFVSSIHHLVSQARTFVFTDRHAYLVGAEFYSNVERLDQIDWQILQNRDFRRDPDDPGKFERYQAEALVYNHMPLEAFFGVVCYTDRVKAQLSQLATDSGVEMKIITETRWYI
ncbi:MAG: DUF4433 domain-containing protein [Oryzomonas sp.]